MSKKLKEVKYRPNIGISDFNTKTKQVAKFLSSGKQVKVTVMFRGREMSHINLGKEVLEDIIEAVSDVGKVMNPPNLNGRDMIMILAPNKGTDKNEKIKLTPLVK